MSYRSKVELDAEVVAEIVEFSGCEVAPVISEDAVRYTKSTSDALEEFYGCGGRLISDRYGLYPFGELVDCYKQMRVSTRR